MRAAQPRCRSCLVRRHGDKTDSGHIRDGFYCADKTLPAHMPPRPEDTQVDRGPWRASPPSAWESSDLPPIRVQRFPARPPWASLPRSRRAARRIGIEDSTYVALLRVPVVISINIGKEDAAPGCVRRPRAGLQCHVPRAWTPGRARGPRASTHTSSSTPTLLQASGGRGKRHGVSCGGRAELSREWEQRGGRERSERDSRERARADRRERLQREGDYSRTEREKYVGLQELPRVLG